MNIVNFFDQPSKKQNTEYFIHLIRIAMADETINESELALLYRIGRNLGITDPEIKHLIETTSKSEFIPPVELARRFEQLYEIVKMTMADEFVDKNETRLATNFAISSGFEEEEIPKLLNLITDGIKRGKDEEDLFIEYKKLKKS